MNTTLIRSAMVAIAIATTATATFAQGDIYSRLFDMQQMDKDKDSMVSKEEFLAMVGKLWDMQMEEKKLPGGKLTQSQLKELEKVLGRSLGSSNSSN